MARPRTASPQNYQVRALQRGLAILRSFNERSPSLGLAEVSVRHGIPKATAMRLLECLVGEGFLTYDPERGRYALGPGALEVGGAYLAASGLDRSAGPFLRRLADQTNQTANLGVLDGTEVLHVSVCTPERPLHYHSTVGARDLVHCTGLGKVLAAHASEDLVREIVDAGLPRRTLNTIVDPAALREEFERVRREGFAEDREEGAPGLRCIAAPVYGSSGRVIAAMSVSGPAVEFEGLARTRMLRHVREAAAGLSDRLGVGSPPNLAHTTLAPTASSPDLSASVSGTSASH
jgi:DNA-binding IclR family transcriptional regulator